MTPPKLRLLLLSAGSAVGQNIIDALGARRSRCVLIGTNSIVEAAYNFCCDIAYLVPPAASGAAYVERLAELIDTERPLVVVPTRDDDVLALALLKERGASGDAVLLTGTVALARMFGDKLETARFAARHGLPFAPTVASAPEALELAQTHGLPLLGKPRSGTASRGVVLLRSREEIARAFESRADLVAQPYLDPPSDVEALTSPFTAGLPFFYSFPGVSKYSLQVMIGPDGEHSEPFGMLAIEAGGRGLEWRRRDDPDLLATGRAYARAAAGDGWRGPLNVQLKRTNEGELVAFELNGRLNGGTAPRALLGFDEMAEIIRRFLPAVDFPALAPPACDVVQLYRTGYAVPRAHAAVLGASGRWAP